MPLASEKSARHSLYQVSSHRLGQVKAFLIPDARYINIVEILATSIAYQVRAPGGNLHHCYNRFSAPQKNYTTRVTDHAQLGMAVDLATDSLCTSDDMKCRTNPRTLHASSQSHIHMAPPSLASSFTLSKLIQEPSDPTKFLSESKAKQTIYRPSASHLPRIHSMRPLQLPTATSHTASPTIPPLS